MQYFSAEIYLYEIALQDSRWSTPTHEYAFRRLDVLYSCLLSTKSFFDTLFTIPGSQFLILPFFDVAPMLHALSVLLKLSLAEIDSWDTAEVRRIVDFSAVLQKVTERFDEVRSTDPQTAHSLQDTSPFSRYVRVLLRVKEWFDAKIVGKSGQAGQPGPDLSSNTEQAAAGQTEELMTFGLFDGLDGAFWPEYMGDEWDLAR